VLVAGGSAHFDKNGPCDHAVVCSNATQGVATFGHEHYKTWPGLSAIAASVGGAVGLGLEAMSDVRDWTGKACAASRVTAHKV